HAEEPVHGDAEVVGEHRERGGVDRAGRSSAHDREGILLRVREHLPDRLEHADLVRRARAAPGQDEPRFGPRGSGTRGHRSAVALASTTVNAVMLTMRLTVAEVVRMCAGLA